jgi:predicted dehydrogenase
VISLAAQRRGRTMQRMSESLPIGLVGCGCVATAYYLPYLRRQGDVRIAALCDSNLRRAQHANRLFADGRAQVFDDYQDMLTRGDLAAVFICTGPGSHVPFTLAALAAGKHVLLQKPMALDLAGAEAIVQATRAAKRVVLVEPSDHSPMQPHYAHLRHLVRQGVLGRPYWFNLMPKGPDCPHPSLGGNPYGEGAFYTKDSGGILFDYPYAPNQIVSLLGPCVSVMGLATNCVPDRLIVHDRHYDDFLAGCTDPDQANYWLEVFNKPRDHAIRNEAPDSVFSLYEMADGSTGVFHTPRIFQPTLKGTGYGDFQVFGSEGNLMLLSLIHI